MAVESSYKLGRAGEAHVPISSRTMRAYWQSFAIPHVTLVGSKRKLTPHIQMVEREDLPVAEHPVNGLNSPILTATSLATMRASFTSLRRFFAAITISSISGRSDCPRFFRLAYTMAIQAKSWPWPSPPTCLASITTTCFVSSRVAAFP
jgi:hypothetical protein